MTWIGMVTTLPQATVQVQVPVHHQVEAVLQHTAAEHQAAMWETQTAECSTPLDAETLTR